MPYAVVISAKAQKKLTQLELYLAARFYPENAERFIDRLVDACESLTLAPYRGTARDDLKPGMRSVGFERKVTIYFKIHGRKVVIVNITYRGSTRGVPR